MPASGLKIATGSQSVFVQCSEVATRSGKSHGHLGRAGNSSVRVGDLFAVLAAVGWCICIFLFPSTATMNRICGDLSWEDLDSLGIGFEHFKMCTVQVYCVMEYAT